MLDPKVLPSFEPRRETHPFEIEHVDSSSVRASQFPQSPCCLLTRHNHFMRWQDRSVQFEETQFPSWKIRPWINNASESDILIAIS